MPRKVLTSKAIKNMGEWNSWPLPEPNGSRNIVIDENSIAEGYSEDSFVRRYI